MNHGMKMPDIHNNKDQYWPAMLGEIKSQNAAGSLFWNYNDTYTSDFDMLQGNSILTSIFKSHADRMVAKNGLLPTSTVTPTPTPTVTVTPTPTPTLVVTPTPTPGTSYLVTYVFQNDWGSGATVNVTITNNSGAAISGWTLAWTFPGNQKISNLWNGSYTQSGTSVSVTDLSYNNSIASNGGTVSFGFQLSYSGSNAKPTDFIFNGVSCTAQ